jgi:hypothetical protein
MVTKIQSGGRISPLRTPVEVVKIGRAGMPGELLIYNGRLYLYGPAGNTLIEAGIIQTDALLAGSITADKLTIGAQYFSHSITWTATDIDTCTWSSGTIKFSDATTDDINAGNTGNITAETYIYYDGTATLKTTTNFATTIGDNKVLLAIVEKGGTGGKCIISPINSSGTTIDGDKIVTGKIQSSDGKTYFDLDTGEFVVNDGSNDRVLIGPIT